MQKILFIDDDFPMKELQHSDVKYITTVSDAKNIFAGIEVFDIVSLDGRMPGHWDLTPEFEEFRKATREYYTTNVAGVYLLYLMKKYCYYPKVIILHSHDHGVIQYMKKLIEHHFADKLIDVRCANKEYIIHDVENITGRLMEDYEKRLNEFPNWNQGDFGITLRKGKNSFIVNGTIKFYKGEEDNTDEEKIGMYRTPDGRSAFIRTKLAQGYEIIRNDYSNNLKTIPKNLSLAKIY